MLLKWLFTLLAILWLYQALRDVFGFGRRPLGQAPPRRQMRYEAPPPPPQPAQDKDAGEYVDYEEIK